MKPFDINKAKQGAKVVTRDGRVVIITTFVLSSTHPITGCILGEDKVLYWCADGRYWVYKDSDLDLFLAEEETGAESKKPKMDWGRLLKATLLTDLAIVILFLAALIVDYPNIAYYVAGFAVYALITWLFYISLE